MTPFVTSVFRISIHFIHTLESLEINRLEERYRLVPVQRLEEGVGKDRATNFLLDSFLIGGPVLRAVLGILPTSAHASSDAFIGRDTSDGERDRDIIIKIKVERCCWR
jgi:hypothetical protein